METKSPSCDLVLAELTENSNVRTLKQKEHDQGKSSSTLVTNDLSKTFHQICLWLHQLVKTRKSAEDSVIYLLGNPQRDVGDWLTQLNKLNTIATYSIPAATCQQQQTTPNHACPCVCACRPEVPPYRKKR